MSACIELVALRKDYDLGGRSLSVLREVNMTVKDGEFVALMGPSGSGKSTLLSIVGGLEEATSGELWVTGQRVDKLSERARARFRGHSVGFVFQSYNLIPQLTAFQNVLIPMEFRRGGLRGRSARLRAQVLLESVGLHDRTSSPANVLSGGEQQRVAIARALANDPPLILADEPTGNLDSENGSAIMNLFADLRDAGKTILLVTHDEHVAARADNVVHIADGAIGSSLFEDSAAYAAAGLEQ